ncbi:hypothetical protein BBK82_25845 [Lentzea guizhouensis]|uniref:PBS lyase n=1 Tax=Lentzea guizhouensis TaxID=1586287 RepID=A0A1B2HMN7_9PSEU|nr:hypothetical protein [Lentzea guizhouensis]ANZ38983.1 hypothetical protein BBK82_25845 [Lentzea guizhouensis]
MLDELETIPWERLEHNRGTAENVPELLRAARTSVEPWAELDDCLFHQGGWVCPAARAALPFTVELASSASVPGRVSSLRLIGHIAEVAGVAEAEFVDDGWPAEWARALPRLVDLAADPDPGVRSGALWALGCGGGPVAPGLVARWDVETDPAVRLDLVLTLGKLAPQWVRELRGDDPQVRLAAACASGSPAVEEFLPGLRADLSVWSGTVWVGGPARVLGLVREALEDRPAEHAAVLTGFEPADDELRRGQLTALGELLTRWRSPVATVLPLLGERLRDPSARVRWTALHLLGSVRAAGYADDVAALLEDETPVGRQRQFVGDAAAWALTRFGRPVPDLVARLDRFGDVEQFFSAAVYVPWLPAAHEVLQPLRDFGLVPAVLDRLAAASGFRRTNFIALLGSWGVPEAAPVLSELAAGEPVAAWAWWRCGGPAELIAAAKVTHQTVKWLGDIGSTAAAHVSLLPLDEPDDWMRVATRRARWRMTGEVGDLVPVCTEVLSGLDDGRFLPVMVPAAQALAEVGERPEVLVRALASDRRWASSGGWRAFDQDERLRAVLEDPIRD